MEKDLQITRKITKKSIDKLMNRDIEQLYFGLINEIKQEMYSSKSNKLPKELIQQISLVSNQIMHRRKTLEVDNTKKREITSNFH